MGALTENRKRPNDAFSLTCPSPPLYSSNSGSPFELPSSKKPRISSMPPIIEKPSDQSSKRTVWKRDLPLPQPLGRTVHGPQRNLKVFGSVNLVRKSPVAVRMGNFQSRIDRFVRPKETRVENWRKSGTVVSGLVVDSNRWRDVMTEDLSVEDYKTLVKGRESNSVVSDWPSGDALLQEPKLDNFLGPSSSAVSDLTVLTWRTGEMIDSVSENHAVDWQPLYKELYESAKQRDSKLVSLDFEVKFTEQKVSYFKLKDRVEEVKKDVAYDEPFVPLTDAEEDYVSDALSGSNRQKLLVSHESSNIEITGEVLLCLRPGGWLNDEVINLYLELLKERERRNPKKFLKCHFFNTFFYKKLISGRSGYDYKAVRRWTTQKKIGYGLIECDKIFVPIHKDIHWCLAIINIKDEKFQYLDSLGGMDSQVLKVLAKYFVDEVKDKSSKDVDVRSWTQEFVDDLPEQENGWDCGMFMIKYADFYSRGLTLRFSQVGDPYLISADGHTQIFSASVGSTCPTSGGEQPWRF